MIRALLAVLGTVGCLACVVPTPPITPNGPRLLGSNEVPPEYRPLQGKWIVTHAQLGAIPMREKVGSVMHFDGNRFWFEGSSGYELIDVDTSVEPYRIDFWERGSVVQGVFRFDGGNLIVCSAPPGIPRPASFNPTAHYRYILTISEREARPQ